MLFFIYPIHLFSDISKIKNKKIFLIEDPRFFTDFKYHKLKLCYHRATMKSYFDYLIEKNINVNYIEFKEVNNFYNKNLNEDIETYELCDNTLKKKLTKKFDKIKIIDTLNFTLNLELINNNLKEFYNGKSYNHQNFYKWQRIRLNILIDKDKNPTGGRWSFDTENRKKLPKDIKIPEIIKLKENKYIEESKKYIDKNFKDNYGSIENFIYPINHFDTKKWLNYFIEKKFNDFGKYEDAESMKDPFLFHSVLTPMMNIGLITDNEVLNIVLKYQDKIPIESFEGFIRQIIGWRNYIYAIFLLEGNKISKMNFMNHTNKIDKEKLWKGKTELKPIDNIIKKIDNFSYAHHIERLMYLGNYLFLCMINPDFVYEIFMEWTIDAYEWVMIPNIYGMSQYSDGGLIMTRPYFSSSNYILKMSDYKKEYWCEIFDSIYYNFINKHQDYLRKNYATSRQVYHWDKKTDKDKKIILKKANEYFKKIGIN